MKGRVKKDNQVLLDNLNEECVICVVSNSDALCVICPLTQDSRRYKKQLAHGFECFLCLSKKDARNRSVFLERFQIFLSSIDFLSKLAKSVREKAEEEERDKYYKIVHNLRHLNAEALGSQYNFIPQEKLVENYSDLFNFVYNEIINDTRGATLTLLKQAKINAHIKTEFDTHELLSMENPILDARNHRVREVILNVYHPYERDFKDKNIHLSFPQLMGYAKFDYRTMRLAIAHILSNAAKYARPNSSIEVTYEQTDMETIISFIMSSIVIHEDELERIFNDGVSGRVPKAHNLNGSGLGMGLIRKAVELNNGTFAVVAGKTYTKDDNGIYYAKNQFIITLNNRN